MAKRVEAVALPSCHSKESIAFMIDLRIREYGDCVKKIFIHHKLIIEKQYDLLTSGTRHILSFTSPLKSFHIHFRAL